MRSQDIIAGKGGHRIISDTSSYTTYDFYGFIPQGDTTLEVLKTGSSGNIARIAETYISGIFYPCPSGLGPGYYNEIKLATGSVCLYLTEGSESKY